MPPTSRRPHHRIWPWWLLGTLVVLVVAIRVAANPLARHFTQQALNRIKGYQGSFEDVRVSFHRLRYTITNLKLVEESQKDKAAPFAFVGKAEGHLDWKDVLHFRFVGSADVNRGKVTIELRKTAEKAQTHPPNLAKALDSLFPFRINHIDLRQNELVVVEPSIPNVPPASRTLWIHDIEASVDNVASRKHLTRGQPAIFELKAKVQHSGRLTLFVTSDPLESGINFAGESSLRGLNIEELWGFIAGTTGVQPIHGTLDAAAAFTCVHGQLNATVKPVLKNAKVAPVDKKLADQLKGALAEAAIKLTQDNVPGRHANVALIPLKGNVLHPEAEVLPTVLSVLRNAYVQAIAGGFYSVPEATSHTPQSAPKQAAQAFNPKKQMKAQPKGK